MKFLKNLFASGAKDLIGELGDTVDDLVTSDEERIALKNAMKTSVMNHKERQEAQAIEHEKQITERHGSDMTSDSWLSKNVRPLTLIFLTVSTVVLAYSSIFLLEPEKLVLVTPWIALLQALLVTVYVFYFGSRGIEKYKKISKGGET